MTTRGQNTVTWLFGKLYRWTLNDKGKFEAKPTTVEEIQQIDADS